MLFQLQLYIDILQANKLNLLEHSNGLLNTFEHIFVSGSYSQASEITALHPISPFNPLAEAHPVSVYNWQAPLFH